MRVIGAGEWNYKNIASILAGRKIIERADSSLVLPYIKNMVAMGLVELLPVYPSGKNMYRLSSPIMEAFFYLADRYNFEERDVSFEEIALTIEKLRNLAIQNFIADLFASVHKGKKEYYATPSNELDFIVTVRNKPILIGEVKWGKYDYSDIRKFSEKASSVYDDVKKIFVTSKKRQTNDIENVKIMDAEDILSLIRTKTV